MSNLPSFKRFELEEILDNTLEKTLGEVDKNNVFAKTIGKPKITGIAGDVIEVSVLDKKTDNKQEPDIIVDGIPTEVKTTGLRIKKLKDGEEFLVGKEPMSITAVSIDNITEEEFETSLMMSQINQMLFVYYHYDSDKTVTSSEYADFKIKGYHIHRFSDIDLKRIKTDWLKVRNYIIEVNNKYDHPEEYYSNISSIINKELMVLDTAPKYPNPPRFRFKRSFVNEIVDNHFQGKLTQPIFDSFVIQEHPEPYNQTDELENIISFEELDSYLNKIEKIYKGKTIAELSKHFNVKGTTKNSVEEFVVKMFGGNKKKLNSIDLFRKTGIIAKSIRFKLNGMPAEETKLFQIDFEEIKDRELEFEDSEFYTYFNENNFLFIMFEQTEENQKMKDNIFIGFKRISFEETFVNNVVRNAWEDTRNKVNNNLLKNVISYDKEGLEVVNKNGVIRSAPNFIKSKDSEIFVRGSGEDSSKKPFVLNGIEMYYQYVWVKSSFLKKILRDEYK